MNHRALGDSKLQRLALSKLIQSFLSGYWLDRLVCWVCLGLPSSKFKKLAAHQFEANCPTYASFHSAVQSRIEYDLSPTGFRHTATSISVKIENVCLSLAQRPLHKPLQFVIAYLSEVQREGLLPW